MNEGNVVNIPAPLMEYKVLLMSLAKYIYIWKALFQYAINVIHNNLGVQCQIQVCKLCFRKDLFLYMDIPIYRHIYKAFFLESLSLNLALTLDTHFGDWHLLRLGKELFIWRLRFQEAIFPRGDKRQSKNRGCKGNANFGGHALEKSSS